MGRTVSRQDGKVLQVKRQACARVSNECKCRLVVLDERMARMNDVELVAEAVLAVWDLTFPTGCADCDEACPNLATAEG